MIERTRNTAGAVIVTGAGRGLGRGIALELAAAGYNVVVNYRGNRDAADRTIADCRAAAASPGGASSDATSRATGPRFLAVQADVADATDRTRLVDTTIAEFGSIRALVNNAGIAPRARADILEATEESFQELIHTNLQGPYFLTQLVARTWLDGTTAEQEKDSAADRSVVANRAVAAEHSTGPDRAIVFVTSISAATVSTNRGEYCISKAGLAMAAHLWAARLAPHNIGVYEIRPGIMATDMTAGVKEKYDALIAGGLVPQRRWGTPEDIGRGVRALIDGDFAYSTGAVISADGGFNISRL